MAARYSHCMSFSYYVSSKYFARGKLSIQYVDNFLHNAQKFEKNTKFRSKTLFPLKMFLGYVECSFENTRGSSFPQSLKQLQIIDVLQKRLFLFSKCSYGHVECSYDNDKYER